MGKIGAQAATVERSLLLKAAAVARTPGTMAAHRTQGVQDESEICIGANVSTRAWAGSPGTLLAALEQGFRAPAHLETVPRAGSVQGSHGSAAAAALNLQLSHRRRPRRRNHSPEPDSLQQPPHVSAHFGVDNQFSGKMIKEATGRTTGGVPINFNETTYDDVYGRMGMFKVRIGYRLTPRTEAVVNFVYSRSGAGRRGDPDRHGGTSPQAPLSVKVTD